MATVHRFPVSEPVEDDSVLARLTRLLRLELELGVAETRELVRSIVLAVAIAVPAAVALIASLVVLLAAALSPVFGARWEALLIAGGTVALLAVAGLAWSTWRLTHLSWPTETLRSFEENWRWLAAQLRSRLTLRSPAA
jgi:uncharacterized membrane protein YbhN (UPF0104 family)